MLANFQHLKSTAYRDMQDWQTNEPMDRHTNELSYAYGASQAEAQEC